MAAPKGGRCPYYVSAQAVIDYARLTGMGDASRDDVFDRAEAELMGLVTASVQQGRKPRKTASGRLLLKIGSSRRRYNAVVSTEPRPEGDLPAIVAVELGFDNRRQRR